MAICTDNVTIGGREYVRTWSDAGMYIHGGFREGDYPEAVDPADAGRVYVETNIPIPGPGDEEISDSEALAIITGEGGGEQ